MFQKTRYQLTIAYVAVLTIILAAFTVAVRFTFTRSLSQQLTVRLENLAKAASFSMDVEDGKLDIDDEKEILVGQDQAIQWFDLHGKLRGEQGEFDLDIPLEIDRLNEIQNYTYPFQARSFTKPVNDIENGKLIGYVRVSESLTELNSTLRKLDWGLGSGVGISLLLSAIGGIWLTHRAMQPIESSFERLKQFTADASHELRSPLMAIQTNADVALKYPEGMRETDEKKFKAISSATQQMTRLTEDLLLLARTDKVTTLNRVPVNLTELLFDLVKLYDLQAQEKGIALEVQITKDLYLLGDEKLLRELFTNLLQNALDYTPNHGKIIIEASQANSNIIVKVKDTGIGIAPEYKDKIFERFWRAEQSRSYQAGKSGLGLAIVQEIVRQHQGAIAVESQLAVGSCFTVRLLVHTYPD
jgi:signal transduction histidine kinase